MSRFGGFQPSLKLRRTEWDAMDKIGSRFFQSLKTKPLNTSTTKHGRRCANEQIEWIPAFAKATADGMGKNLNL